MESVAQPHLVTVHFAFVVPLHSVAVSFHFETVYLVFLHYSVEQLYSADFSVLKDSVVLSSAVLLPLDIAFAP